MITQNEAIPTDESASAQETRKRRPFDWISWLMWLSLTVIIGASAYAISRRPPATTTVWAPIRDLPAYHLITATDVMTRTVAISSAPAKPVSAFDALDLRYTRQSLTAGQAIEESQLVPITNSVLVSDTVPVSIPATPVIVFNGRLASSAIVTVWMVTSEGQTEALLDEALVLDVQKVEGQDESKENAYPYVVILAVPRSKQAELLTAVATNSLILTLAP